MTTVDRLIERLESMSHTAQARLGEHCNDVRRDPRYAFQWADGAIHAGAAMSVFEFIIGRLESVQTGDLTIREAIAACDSEAESRIADAVGMVGGSSATANAMKRALGKAWLTEWTHSRSGIWRNELTRMVRPPAMVAGDLGMAS